MESKTFLTEDDTSLSRGKQQMEDCKTEVIRKLNSSEKLCHSIYSGGQEKKGEVDEADGEEMTSNGNADVHSLAGFSQITASFRNGEKGHHLCENGAKSPHTGENLVLETADTEKSRGNTLYMNSKLSSSGSAAECKENGYEPIEKESNSMEPVGGQDTNNLSSMAYNFDDPVMAINYMGEFKTPEDNYTKGCKWSPDGSCLLVASNDSRMRLLNLPPPVLQGQFHYQAWFEEEAENYAKSAITVRERELVYDYCWYPLMNSSLPDTCCFAVTSRDQPIHLWDAWDGRLICGYYSYNHLDEMVAAYSVGFNLDGTRLIAGFSKCLRVFHTRRPGRYFDQIDAKEHPGIISCTSFNPMLPSVFAAGSYLGSIGLYNIERNNLFCRIDGDMGGVTHIKFSSCGTKLFSGSRKNSNILCWDIRNPGTLLCGFKREVSTSQRIYFDLEPKYTKFLVSGDTRGQVLKWDLEGDWKTPVEGESVFVLEPSSVFMAHRDCTNGVNIHPHYPILATSSGQRHFPDPVSESDADSSSETEESRSLFTKHRMHRENTVKLWWLADL